MNSSTDKGAFLSAYQDLIAKFNISPASAATTVVTAAVAEPKVSTRACKRALLIGINYFGQDGELHGCHADVKNMQAYLKDSGYTDFTVLLDSKSDPKFKNLSCPTRTNILSAMKAFVAKAVAGDTLYFHYSGHGSQLWDDNGEEADCNDECICPVDYSGDKPDSGFIRDDDMSAIFVKGLPAGVKLRVCFDSCHSGSALDLPFRWVSNNRMVTENKTETSSDIVFISGCMDSQTSADSTFNGQSSGAMTWSLLQALYDIKKSGKNSAKWTWKELVQTMRLKLKTEQYDQIPQMGLSAASRATEFVDL